MKRTTVYLTDEQLGLLGALAERRGTSVAELVRAGELFEDHNPGRCRETSEPAITLFALVATTTRCLIRQGMRPDEELPGPRPHAEVAPDTGGRRSPCESFRKRDASERGSAEPRSLEADAGAS
jgi:hypothetical protein